MLQKIILLWFAISDHSFGYRHLNGAATAGQISSESMNDFLHIDFSGWRSTICPRYSIAPVGHEHLVGRPIQGFTPRIREEIDIVIAIECCQVTGKRVTRASNANTAAAAGRGWSYGNRTQGNNIELEMVLPIGRFAAKLLHVGAKDRIDITVASNQNDFDRWWRFGAAVATAEMKKQNYYQLNR